MDLPERRQRPTLRGLRPPDPPSERCRTLLGQLSFEFSDPRLKWRDHSFDFGQGKARSDVLAEVPVEGLDRELAPRISY
jgi:hypothetical protein